MTMKNEGLEALANKLLNETPTDALELALYLMGSISQCAFPELVECAITDDGETYAGVRCPHCEHELSGEDINVVDWGTRETGSSDISADERWVSMYYDDPVDAETLHYKCSYCDKPINLPTGWEEHN